MSVLDKIKGSKKQREERKLTTAEAREATGIAWLLTIARDAMADVVDHKQLKKDLSDGKLSSDDLGKLLLEKCNNEDVCKDIQVYVDLMQGKNIAQDNAASD